MAIHDNFNLDRAKGSQSYAYKCWYNYNYGNNTMGISAKAIGEITQSWKGELQNWQATALDDVNAYEIEDDDFDMSRANGKEQAKDKAHYEGGGKGKMAARGVLDSTLGLAGSAISLTGKMGAKIAGNLVSQKGGKIIGGNLIGNTAENIAKGSGKATTKEACKKIASWSIAAPLALATATLYQAKKPNKEQKKACDELQNEMVNAQDALNAAQNTMTNATEDMTELADKAQDMNEKANDEIKDNKAEYDTYKATYDALMEKVHSGETLTEDEKQLLKELTPIMQGLGEEIADTQEETTEETGAIYSDLGDFEEEYDYAAETVGEVEGLTDYAESFDKATQTMCYVEAGAQGLNAASGTQAGIKAGISAAASFGFNAWAWACAAMGASAGAISGAGAAEQIKWAGEVGTEINMREATQDVNNMTNEIYDESIGNYEGTMEGVDDLEIAMPEDLEDMDEVNAQFEEDQNTVNQQKPQGSIGPMQTRGMPGQPNVLGQQPQATTFGMPPQQGQMQPFGMQPQQTNRAGGTSMYGGIPLATTFGGFTQQKTTVQPYGLQPQTETKTKQTRSYGMPPTNIEQNENTIPTTNKTDETKGEDLETKKKK